MRKIKYILITLLFSLIAFSCKMDNSIHEKNKKTFVPDYGNVVISLDKLMADRGVAVDYTTMTPTLKKQSAYKIELYVDDVLQSNWISDDTTIAYDKLSSDDSILIPVGVHDFKIDLRDSHNNLMAFSTITDFTIVNGVNVLEFPGITVSEKGKGNISIEFQCKEANDFTVTKVEVGLYSRDDISVPVEGTAQNFVITPDSENPGYFGFSYEAVSVPSGEYFLVAKFLNQYKVQETAYTSIIHVNPGLTTSDTVKLIDSKNSIKNNTYRFTYDTKGGLFVEGYTPQVDYNALEYFIFPTRKYVKKDGYTLYGWAPKDPDLRDMLESFMGMSYTSLLMPGMVTFDVEWEAVWVPNTSYITMLDISETEKDEVELDCDYEWVYNPSLEMDVPDFNYWYLYAPEGYSNYTWYLDGVEIPASDAEKPYEMKMDLNDWEGGTYPLTLEVTTDEGEVFTTTVTIYKATLTSIEETNFIAHITEVDKNGVKIVNDCFVETPVLDYKFWENYEYYYGGTLENITEMSFEGILEVGSEMFEGYLPKLEKIEFADGLMYIDDYAFCGAGLSEQKNPTTGNMEYVSSGLKIILPYTVSEIGDHAFDYTGLTELTIPQNTYEIGDCAFFTQGGFIKNISVHPDNVHFSAIDDVLYNEDQTVLYLYLPGKTAKSFTIPKTVYSIVGGAFSYAKNLENIVFEGTLDSLGPQVFESSGIKTFDFTKAWGETVTKGLFKDCANLTKITLNEDVVTVQEDAFANCPKLSDIIFKGIEAPVFGARAVYIDSAKFEAAYYANTLADYYDNTALVTIWCPVNSVQIYKGMISTIQSDYAYLVMPESEYYADVTLKLKNVKQKGSEENYKKTIRFYFDTDELTYTEASSLQNYLYANNFYDYEAETISLGGIKVLNGKAPSSTEYIYNTGASNFFTQFSGIKNVILPDTLIRIGQYGMAESGGVVEYTYDPIYGYSYKCKSTANKLTIPESVVTIEEHAFMFANYEEIEFSPSANVTFVTDLYKQEIQNNNKITSNADIYGSLDDHVDDIYYTFCSKGMKNITFPSNSKYLCEDGVVYNRRKNTLIMYLGGKEDKRWNIPDGVTKIEDRAFQYAQNLEYVDVASTNTFTKTLGQYVFFESSVIEAEFNTRWSTEIPDKFYIGAHKLVDARITDGVEKIGKQAYESLKSLKNVTVGKDMKTVGFKAFASTPKLLQPVLDKDTRLENWLDENGNINTNSSYGNYAFSYSGVESFDWDERWGPIVPSYGFYYCSSLKNFSIHKSIKNIYYQAFGYCTTPEFTFDADATIDDAPNYGSFLFYGCKYTSFDWHEKWGRKIPYEAFGSNSLLEEFTINDNVNNIESYAFAYCYKLDNEKIHFSEDARITTLGSYVFSYCYAFKNFTWSKKWGTKISASTFYYCTALESVNVESPDEDPSTKEVPLMEIGYSAFGYCSKLKSVVLDNKCKFNSEKMKTLNSDYYGTSGNLFIGCTALESFDWNEQWGTVIPKGCFNGCNKLKNFTMNNKVTVIENSAFKGCTVLNNITIPASVNQIGYRAFMNTGSCTVTIEDADNPNNVWYKFSDPYVPNSTNDIYYYDYYFYSSTPVIAVEDSGTGEEIPGKGNYKNKFTKITSPANYLTSSSLKAGTSGENLYSYCYYKYVKPQGSN